MPLWPRSSPKNYWQRLTVTLPDGGENWMVTPSHDITWTSTGTIANVSIEYSTDGGTNWTSTSVFQLPTTAILFLDNPRHPLYHLPGTDVRRLGSCNRTIIQCPVLDRGGNPHHDHLPNGGRVPIAGLKP